MFTDGAVFPVTEAGVDKSILAWARAAFASENELVVAGWDSESDKWSYNKAATAMAYFDEPISPENESQVCLSKGIYVRAPLQCQFFFTLTPAHGLYRF